MIPSLSPCVVSNSTRRTTYHMLSAVSNMVAELERSNQLQKAQRSAGEPHIQTCVVPEVFAKRWHRKQLKCHSSSPKVQQLRIRHGRSSREGARRTGFSGERLNCFETIPHRHEGGYPRHVTEPQEQSCTSHAGAPVESCTVMRGDFQGRHDTGKAHATQR